MSSTADEARMVRKRATACGLRLTRRGNIFELRDDSGVVIVGSLLTVDGYVRERFVGKKPGPAAARIPAAWAPMIAEYCLSLAAAGQSSSTIRLRRLSLAALARGLGLPPSEVTGDQLVQWFGRQTHWQPETRRNHRSAVRCFFAWAYRTGRVSDYLSDHLPVVKMTAPSPRPVPDQAWADALTAASPRVRVMLRLAGEAGLRRAEVAQVHSSDLLDSAGGAQLLVHGKGGKPRVIPISSSLSDVLRAGAAGHTPGMSTTGWLFPTGSGGHLTPEHVGKLVERVLPDGYTMHKLRTRFATRAYRGTRNLRAVQVLLGHASIATTERYTAVDDDEIRAAMMSAMTP